MYANCRMKFFLTTIIVLSVCIVGRFSCSGVEYFVSPTPLPNPNCPEKSICHILSDYVRGSQLFFNSHNNISLLFLNGTHNLELSFFLEDYKKSLSFYMASTDSKFRPTIVVPHKIKIMFVGFRHLKVQDIIIFGNDLPTLYFTVYLVTISRIEFSSNTFRTSSINITYPVQPDYSKVNDIKVATFTNCEFLSSSIFMHYNFISPYGDVLHESSGWYQQNRLQPYYLYFSNCLYYLGSLNIRVNSALLKITIQSCTFEDSTSTAIGMSNSLVGHHDDDRSNVQLFLENSTISNSSLYGIAIAEIYNMSLCIHDTVITKTGSLGILVMRIYNLIRVELDKCEITECQSGAISINSDAVVVVRNSILSQNTNYIPENGVGLIVACQGSIQSGVEISNTAFTENHGHADYGRVVDVSLCNTVSLSDVYFERNVGASIRLSSNDLHVKGNVQFVNNTAYKGGGMSLLYSQLHLYNNTNVTFVGNRANDVGGGVYVDQVAPFVPVTYTPCFYVFPQVLSSDDVRDLNVHLKFENNTAANGGLAIYGASVTDYCLVAPNSDFAIYSGYYYTLFFEFVNADSNLDPLKSLVASNPSRVCLCGFNTPVCLLISYIFAQEGSVFPGETVEIAAVIVGKDYGATTGTVFANALGEDSIDTTQYTQKVLYSKCNALTYTVYSKPLSNFSLVLTTSAATVDKYGNRNYVKEILFMYPYPGDVENVVMSLPVFVNYTVDDCPPGFILSTILPLRCECDARLLSIGITHCVIRNHTGFVYRNGFNWLASFPGVDNSTYQLVLNVYCLTGYCRTQNISLDLLLPDDQCVNGRSGTLCGQCKGNLSLSIGSSLCIECNDNWHVALILPFAVGFVLLVALIKLLDLTVKQGTLNGIILYANIIWANRNIFFQKHEPVLETFIAWLNLEFGIDVCFIKGLDAFWKTWLFFAHDFITIVGITLLIILSTKYSRRATKLIGANVVPVLATLYFLSYAKLLQTIISMLSFHILEYPTHVQIVWSMDGNLQYFGVKHLALFVVALGALFLLWLPYTFILLFFSCLQKKSYLRCLRWTDSLRLKPYMDAYFGPLKSKHRYWFGLLLLIRVTLVIFNLLSDPHINLVAIIVLTTLLLCFPFPYENWQLSLFERLLFLNLITLSSSVLFANVVAIDGALFVYISISIVFVQLIAVILFHLYSTVKIRCCTNQRNTDSEIDDEFLDHVHLRATEELGSNDCDEQNQPQLINTLDIDTY